MGSHEKEVQMHRKPSTFTIRGFKVRSASQRRFIVVVGREHEYAVVRDAKTAEWITDSNFDPARVAAARAYPAVYTVDTYIPYVEVFRRTDSIETARTVARRKSQSGFRGFVVVIDTATGNEV
jgi:hypothetical protein